MKLELQYFDDVFKDPVGAHPSDYALISHCQKEHKSRQQLTLKQHLIDCSHCRQRLAQMTEQRNHFEKTSTFEEIQKTLIEPGRQIHSNQQVEKISFGRRGFPIWPALVTASVVAILIICTLVYSHLHSNKVINDSKDRSVSIKGVDVVWAVKRGEHQLNADKSFVFQAGDLIGFQITASRAMFAMVVSVNNRGTIRPLTSKPVTVAARQKTTLPLSLLIQPPFETERIFVILTSSKLTVQETVRSINTELSRIESTGKGIHELTSLPIKGLIETRLIEIN